MPSQKSITDYGERAKNETVKIFADERERNSGIFEELKKYGARVDVQVLNVGDFILSDRVVVERKTRQDFENSIIDGRLFQQAPALQSFPKPIIIIEGESFEERVRKEALLGALASLMLDFNIQLFFTRNAEKTAEMMYAIAKREQITEQRPVRMLGDKRARTLAQQQQMLVECLPHIGPKLAQALLRNFKSIENLMNASEKDLQEVEKVGRVKARDIRKLLAAIYKPDNSK